MTRLFFVWLWVILVKRLLLWTFMVTLVDAVLPESSHASAINSAVMPYTALRWAV